MSFEELKKQVNNCNTLDDLFELWKKAHKCEDDFEKTTITETAITKNGIFDGISQNAFVKDGYICEKEYKSAPQKILFILKEANIQTHRNENQLKKPSEDSQIGFYTEYINDPDCRDNTPKQHEKMGRMAHYIIYNEDIKDLEVVKSSLAKTAFMNVNKRGGGASTNEKKFRNYEKKYAPYIERQIKILNPDVIVIIGKTISDMIVPDKYLDRIIKVYHTAYRYKKNIYKPDGYMKEFIEEYKIFNRT